MNEKKNLKLNIFLFLQDKSIILYIPVYPSTSHISKNRNLDIIKISCILFNFAEIHNCSVLSFTSSRDLLQDVDEESCCINPTLTTCGSGLLCKNI